MVANTGTYVDVLSTATDGVDLVDMALDVAELDGAVLTRRACGRAIDRDFFEGQEMRGGCLVRTGWDRHWTTPAYFEGHPYLTRAAAQYLRDAGVSLVGIDSLNIDDTRDGSRPAHTILLGSQIPIAEHLCNLGDLPAAGFRFHAVPARFRGVGTFPVRAYGVVP